ncbi:MAG: hypothetical protein GF320_10225 [Armatimonadia bacterium]|nr:hypothetical protein [Armatimonadia bacterium]
MYTQYSPPLPGVEWSGKGAPKSQAPEECLEELTEFYEAIMAGDWEYFALAEDYAPGFYTLLDALAATDANGHYVKGQVTGPISYGLSVTDAKDQAVLHNDQMADATVKGLAAQARWQAARLSQQTGRKVIIFFDEPYLSALGSGYMPVTPDRAVDLISQVVSATQEEGALVGIHCCGNTDWSLVMDTGADIVNFDAYEYLQGMLLYPDALRGFLERGGTLAWGLVPSSDAVNETSTDDCVQHFFDSVDKLAAKGLPKDLLQRSVLITPSCGAGTLDVQTAETMIARTREAADAIRARL